ncbi:MAG: hypothetical protein IPG93_00275 [Burkholderiales bacterium]|nr:hypothetical protein [Burkholderiales bacterium]
MRWKLLRRRWSVSAPRMHVRSNVAWPLRWLALALVLGFSAAVGLWAFDFGREIAGLDSGARKELARLREEVSRVTTERDRLLSVANSADSMLKTEQAAQQKLASQLKQLEEQNLALTRDLGFFERLLPAAGAVGKVITVRGLQAELDTAGRIHYQSLVMFKGARNTEFRGNFELSLSGTLDGKPWTMTPPAGQRALAFKQYQRLEGDVEFPPTAVVKQVQIKVIDASGVVQATEVARL